MNLTKSDKCTIVVKRLLSRHQIPTNQYGKTSKTKDTTLGLECMISQTLANTNTDAITTKPITHIVHLIFDKMPPNFTPCPHEYVNFKKSLYRN